MRPPDAPHAILAHYFAPPAAQGALTLDEWERLLDVYGDRLISAPDWLARAVAGTLTNECAVSMDDGLAEQLPAIKRVERRGLRAFVNPYTQPLVGVPHSLEIHRATRNRHGVEDFYARWHELVKDAWDAPSSYLAEYGYLTDDDRAFRFWRNELAEIDEYERVMRYLALDAPSLPLSHWLSASDLRALHAAGHVIGAHTHSHPTTMHNLTREQQQTEWATSKYVLESILGEPVTTASWPCGQVAEHGIEWMSRNGIVLAWGATMTGSMPYCVPRWSSGYWRKS